MNSCLTKEHLHELGTKLINPNEIAAGKELRNYQDELKYLIDKKLESLSDLHRFIAFFLDTFIDDLFYNLAGDYPYRKDLENNFRNVWHGILKNMGETFIRIAEQIDEKNHELICQSCTSMVSFYLEKISFINSKLMEEPA